MKYYVIITLVLFTMGACTKYPDGPGFSLRSKENRLKGHWFVKSSEASFKPISGSGSPYTVSLTKDFADEYLRWQFIKEDGVMTLNVYTGTTTNVDYSGQCNFSDNGEDLYIDFDYGWVTSNRDRDTLNIRRLTNKELWLDQVYYQYGYNGANSDTKYEVTVSTKWQSF